MPLLELNNVSCAPWGKTLLSGINLRLEAGEIHGLIGTNGAGKSTLLRCISGEIAPDEGEVLLTNRPIGEWNTVERARQLALLPQQALLNFPFTVKEVVSLGRIPHATGFARDQIIVEQAMSATDVSNMATRLYTQLSGGEKQRVQLARIFAQVWSVGTQGNQLILLDEPTNGLDLGHQQMLMEQLRRLANDGFTIVLVLHDFNIIASIADNITVLHQAQVTAQGSPQEVLTVDLFRDIFSSDVDIVPHPRHHHPVVIQS